MLAPNAGKETQNDHVPMFGAGFGMTIFFGTPGMDVVDFRGSANLAASAHWIKLGRCLRWMSYLELADLGLGKTHKRERETLIHQSASLQVNDRTLGFQRHVDQCCFLPQSHLWPPDRKRPCSVQSTIH